MNEKSINEPEAPFPEPKPSESEELSYEIDNEESNSTTPFDDSFRTLLEAVPEVFIPLINEVYGTDYSLNENVIQFKNEHVISGKKLITDSHLYVGELSLRDHHYHFECESNPDGTIVLRMMQYDMLIALDTIEKTASDEYRMRLPKSAVLYIRHNKATPDHIIVKLQNENNESLNHEIKVIKIGKYTINQLFEKRLIVLYPFFIVNYEDEINSDDWDQIKTNNLLSEYQEIYCLLQEYAKAWQDPEYLVRTLQQTAKTLAAHVLRKKPDVKERMDKIMGGNVLDDPFIKLKIDYNHLKAENRDVKAEIKDVKAENKVVKAENKVVKAENKVVKAENKVVKAENKVVKAEYEKMKQKNLYLISLLEEHGIAYE